MKKASSELGSQGSENSSISVTFNEKHQPKPKTQHQKFKAAHTLLLRMATVISEAGTKECNMKKTQTKELLQYWENGISVEVIRKECTSNDEEVSGDGEMSDDDDLMSEILLTMTMMVMYLEWVLKHKVKWINPFRRDSQFLR